MSDPKEKIFIVEDDEDILELMKYNVVKEGYQVFTETAGDAALQTARTKMPDLILLDLMLPGLDGLEICRTLKNEPKTKGISIMMVTAKGEEADIVTGLEMGADDYITKPFSPRVLLARIKAVLRRKKTTASPEESTTVKVHDLVIDPSRHEIMVKNKLIDLTFTEFKLLEYFARRPGRVFTRYQIVDGVKGADYAVTERSVDVQIVGLRKKLGSSGKLIETVRGIGYKLKD